MLWFRKENFFPLLLLSVLLAGCSSQNHAKTDLVVSAAASLTDVMNEMKGSFEKEHPEVHITYNFGSSGKLAMQIGQGAPCDIFLSAGTKEMDDLESKQLLLVNTRIDFAKNELVLVTKKKSDLNMNSFTQIQPDQVQHFAMGEPESVPAGRYTKETLEKLNLWNALQPKLVFASNVRQVLAYVDSGNAELGIVYASDVIGSQNTKVLATAKSEWHQPIQYPGAVLIGSAHQPEAKAFLTFLTSEDGRKILSHYGLE